MFDPSIIWDTYISLTTSTTKKITPEKHLEIRRKCAPAISAQETQSAAIDKLFSQSYGKNSEAYKIRLRALVMFVAEDLRPLYLVQCPGFQRFVKALDPRFKLPSRVELLSER